MSLLIINPKPDGDRKFFPLGKVRFSAWTVYARLLASLWAQWDQRTGGLGIQLSEGSKLLILPIFRALYSVLTLQPPLLYICSYCNGVCGRNIWEGIQDMSSTKRPTLKLQWQQLVITFKENTGYLLQHPNFIYQVTEVQKLLICWVKSNPDSENSRMFVLSYGMENRDVAKRKYETQK